MSDRAPAEDGGTVVDEGLELDPDELEPEVDPPEPDEAEADEPEDPSETDEPDEPAAVAPGGRARGETYGAQIRRIEAQRVADKAEFDRQLAALVAERRAPSAAEIAEAQAREQAHFEMMSPWEQHQYSRQIANQEVERRTNQIAHNLWDQNDQRDYTALLETTPAYRRLSDTVEELRRRAPNVSRRVLLATAIGLRALEQGGAAKTRATRAAEAGVTRNRVTPSSGGRGDVSPDRGGRRDNLEERLRGQNI
jgi:hypothetical protein